MSRTNTNLNICLLGYGGHGYVVAEALKLLEYKSIFYADTKENVNNPFEIKYLGFEKDEKFPWENLNYFALGIGDNKARYKMALTLAQKGKELPVVIHPNANLTCFASIGEGSFIARGCCINPMVQIGKFAILNTCSIIEHECNIGQAVHIAPGAVLSGNVKVGDFSFIGANAVVKQDITIGSNTIVGAGAVVINDVPENSIIIGNPARILKK